MVEFLFHHEAVTSLSENPAGDKPRALPREPRTHIEGVIPIRVRRTLR